NLILTQGAPAPEVLNDLLPSLVTEYGHMGAAVAADWYDEAREVAEARGMFRAIPLAASDRGVSGLIGHSLVTATDDGALQAWGLGGVRRRRADRVRLSVTRSSVAGPGARGWMRVGHGACGWCGQYRVGEVRTTAGYDFGAH